MRKYPIISFIIPVYNVEPYLHKCVDSILAQDYDDYEIILIDDGSPDSCPQICDEYAKNYSNVRVIHQANSGLSAARNTGIESAKGDYICFVDSDDFWEPNVLGGLMAQVEREQLDVLRFDYQNVRIKTINDSGVEYEIFEPYKSPRLIDDKDEVVDGETYLNTRMGYACYAVMFIMSKTVVPEFMLGIHAEDVEWLPRMMLQAQKVNFTRVIVYNYFIREGSITQTQGDNARFRRNVDDSMCVISRYTLYRAQYPTCHWIYNMQSLLVANVIDRVASDMYSESDAYLARLQALNVFPLSISNQGKSYIRKAMLINLSPRIAMKLLHLRRR